LSIRRNWYEDDPLKNKREHFVHYQYMPGLGFYGFGLIHMIGGLAKSATSLLRQLVDAGTLSNLPGGLKSRGLRIKGDDTPIMPGEFRDVDVPGGAIRDNIAFLPYKEPSNVLYQLMGDIVEEGRRFASAADVKASDMNGEAPVGTTLAILERSMKVMSAVQARLHASMRVELRLLTGIVRDHGPEAYPYEEDGEPIVVEDFDNRIDIIPVSDPNAGTMAQRIMQYQAALQLAAQAPEMYDMPLLHRQMLEVLGIRDADEIVPTDKDMKPTDPVSENMNIINGKPVKAFIYQDHEAHIQTHMAMIPRSVYHGDYGQKSKREEGSSRAVSARSGTLGIQVPSRYREAVGCGASTPRRTYARRYRVSHLSSCGTCCGTAVRQSGKRKADGRKPEANARSFDTDPDARASDQAAASAAKSRGRDGQATARSSEGYGKSAA
jgi:hypothetical protein